MLYVTIELVPFGDITGRKKIGGIVIGRIGEDGDGYAYGAAKWHDRCPDAVNVVGLTSFQRRDEGLWDLLGEVLRAPPRRHGISPTIEATLRRHLAGLVPSSSATDGRGRPPADGVGKKSTPPPRGDT